MLWNPPEKLQTLCAPLTPIQFNGRYCLSFPQVTTLSLGIHHPEHFDQNLKILGGDTYFSPEQKEIEQRVRFPLQNFSSECTYCSECLPCPEDINIPEILRFRNLLKAYDMKDYGKYRYNMLEGKGHWFPGHFAFACTECGDCLPKCPEKLDIPRLLFETHHQLFDRKAYLKNKVMEFLKKIYFFLFRR